VASAAGCHLATAVDDAWQNIGVEDYWTTQVVNHHAIAWYATKFVGSELTGSGRLWLLFGMIAGDSEV
jgi:hypothetical protein